LAFYRTHQMLDSKPRLRSKSLSLAIILVLGLSAILALQFSPSVTAAGLNVHTTRAQSVSLDQTLTLRRGYYNYYEIDSFSNNTTVAYAAVSSAPISTALMTATQLNDFEDNLNDPISNSVTYVNGTSAQNNMTITTGQYFLVFYAYYSRANIQFGYQTSPNTPFSYGPLSTSFASGISTFGISNNSGTVSPYEVRTNEIVGIANISSLQVLTRDANQYGVSPTGATIQLNALLVVNDNSGQKVYWVQNVPDFETGPVLLSIGDEIWNWTDLNGYLSNQTITSTNFNNGGFVSGTGPGNSGGPYVYNYNGNNETYNLPLRIALVESETILPKTGVLVQLGDIISTNGSASVSPKINWFDNVTIVDPTVQTAYYDVSGGSTPPIGLFYDAELVFAGEGNLEVAHFTQLSASLGLFYHNSGSATNMLSSFPTYYSFSGDTGESADDLVVTYSNGIANVGTGVNPNYQYLGNASRILNLQTQATTTTTTASTSSTTTTTTTTTVTSSTTTTSSSSTQTTTTKTTTSSTTQSTSSSTSSSTSTQQPTTTTTTSTTTRTSSTPTATSSSSQTTTSQATTSSTQTSQSTSTPSASSSTSNTGSSSSSSTSASSSGTSFSPTSNQSTTSTSSKTSGSMPAWEWAAVGVAIGVLLASLAFTAMRRRPVVQS